MAHGRKRFFVAGVLLGGLMAIVGCVVLVYLLGITLVEPGRPWFPANARQVTMEWARLSAIPESAKGFQIITEGGPFTRSFRITFFGDPKLIAKWVNECPGTSDPKCVKETQPDGSILYEIPPAGGAGHAELLHHPQRGTVEVYTYWS